MAEKKNGATKQQSVSVKLRLIGKTALRYNIGVRFISFVILVALLSGGVVGLVMVRTSRDYFRQQALRNNLNQANLAASYASSYVAAVEAHVKVFATRPDVVQAVLNGQASQLQSTLADFVQIQTALSGVGVYDTAGIQLTYSLSTATTIGQSFVARNWFQGVISTGQPYLGTPLLSAAMNIPVETFAVPVVDAQGNILAILAAGISLTQLSSSLVNIGFNTNTQALLIDTRDGGSIIADNNPAFLLTAPAGDRPAVDQLLTGKSGSTTAAGSNGQQDLTGFAAVSGLPWGVLVVTPSSAAFAIINSLTERAVIYVALIILLSGIFGVFLVLGITRPLNRLMQDTEEIGSGKLDIKLETSGKDEIGDLARAFSQMAAKLKSTMVSRDDLAKEVTERKKTEELLKESEYRYRSLFENMSNGLAYCRMFYQDGIPVDFKYLAVNRAFETQTGLKDAEGKMVSEVIPGIRDSDPEIFTLYGRVASTGVPEQREMFVESLKMWFSISVYSPQKEYFVAIFDVITERKQAENALQASEVRYRRLFEAARDGILILDVESGAVVDVNPFMVDMLGFSRQEFLHRKIWELGFFKDIIANRDNFEELKRKQYITYENMPLETASGKRIQVEFVSHLYEVGNQKVIQCNIRDITERKLLEQEKEKYSRELVEKNTELERFTYTVSHDLKSPLVTIKTFLGYLSQDMAAGDKQRIDKDVVFMNTAADKMGLLLQELLEMSRVGRIVNPSVESSSAEIIQEAIGMLAGSIADRGVIVQVSGESVSLFGDRSRLIEIWQNLLENAVKFMGDRISPQVEIGVERQGSETVFSVRDNGVGIAPQYQSKIFNLFEKINAKTEGTGMGLAIVKRIVELYQGKIWVESKGDGQGTSFFFTLPGALVDKDNGGKV